MSINENWFYYAEKGVYMTEATHRGHFYRRYRFAWLAEKLFMADRLLILWAIYNIQGSRRVYFNLSGY